MASGRTKKYTHGRRDARILASVAVAGAFVLIAAGCTSQDNAPVKNPTRVLQTVDTRLAPDGSITGISDTAISVNSAKQSSSDTTTHDPAKVAKSLPIRVTTQYTAGAKTGTDLSDLDGYSGRVEIDLTVENLTVQSKQITYDVAGSSRTTAALVGAPFSVAASTVLDGTKPSSIVTDSSESAATTDGVVSTDDDGNAVVQWGTLLAPPTSGASSTLHLVANVAKFRAPSFDIAAQPGISTDLSSQGVLSSAFGSSQDSELALQRRTISLISQVNEVLARAGGTITEVRSNLETTSQTLGVSTAERLKESSSQLASTMQGLSGELSSLKGDLGATVTTTQSTVTGQLQQTVSSLDSLLGDTSATAPAVQLVPTSGSAPGDQCALLPSDTQASATVYGSLLRVSAQLNGYADASEQCRQQVSAQLAASVGPQNPDAATCAEGTPASESLTCALFDSSTAISGSLIGLVQTGKDLAKRLQPDSVDDAIASAAKLNEQLGTISTQLDDLQKAGDGGTGAALGELKASADALDQSIGSLASAIGQTHDQADAARSLLDGNGFPLSLERQNSAVADQLCTLAALGRLDQSDADALRGYLTSTPCAGAPEGTTLQPGLGFSTPMDQRLADQATRWQGIADSTATDSTVDGSVGAALTGLRNAESTLRQKIEAVQDSAQGQGNTTGSSIKDLRDTLAQAVGSQAVIAGQLTTVQNDQVTLSKDVEQTFAKASSQSSDAFRDTIDQQVRNVSSTAKASNDAVVKAFDTSIDGLRATSSEVTSDSKGTIDKQKGSLRKETSGLTSAIDAQTAQSLQRIDQSTTASTRDVEGASTLLTGDLNRVMLDLGDRKVNGSGILGAMATSAAKSDTADYQLALASQNAAGYANVRAEDVAGILLQQAQFQASLDAATKLPAFELKVPNGATSTTLYTFRIGAAR